MRCRVWSQKTEEDFPRRSLSAVLTAIAPYSLKTHTRMHSPRSLNEDTVY